MLKVDFKLVKCALLAVSISFLASNANADMFGHGEAKYDDIHDFKKWKEVVKKAEMDEIVNGPITQKWHADIAKIGAMGLTREQKIAAVNDYMNKSIIYAEDIDVWGVTDYWTSPTEVLAKGYGDCEDYAIAKYYSLKQLGFNDEDMRIVVLKDTRKNELHAILVINENGTNYVLDNQNPNVMADSQIAYYQPIYSINEHNWWKHS